MLVKYAVASSENEFFESEMWQNEMKEIKKRIKKKIKKRKGERKKKSSS